MKTKYLLSAVLIISISLCGCSSKKKDPHNEEIPENKSVASDIKTSDAMTANFDDLIGSFTINGADVTFPATIESLGKGYSYDKKSVIAAVDSVYCNLLFNNSMIGTCQLTQCTDDNYMNKPFGMISVLNEGKKKGDPDYTEASIGEVNMDSKLEDVTKALGDPQQAVYDKGTKTYELSYIKDDENMIEINVADTVNKIAFYYVP